jgi:chromosome transmission fidelity protein 1
MVPHGIAVFVPSYSYEQVLVDALKSMGIWEALHAVKPISRELKQLHQVNITWKNTCSNTGALLFSVMGDKLSEGMNFSNVLCCSDGIVIFVDRSDPLLLRAACRWSINW